MIYSMCGAAQLQGNEYMRVTNVSERVHEGH